ncbi:MAG TPA: M20/M25/M40 family metallo-hydrolase [Actinomycetota bacterium]|nr:M20/M25/M40 family metallo-hydrolase [Actinomycetota bacterium]
MKKPLAIACLAVCLPAAPALAADHPKPMGDFAYQVVKDLNSQKRVQGTPGERAAAKKIRAWFKTFGYHPKVQKFSFTRKGTTYQSRNVTATLPGKGKKPPLVIIGAHYDSQVNGYGADDNASGVAVMLEVAKRMANKRLPATVKFVAFGAEENPGGLEGSNRYVNAMNTQQIKRTHVMINFDSLLVGDHMYVHAGTNKKVWARDRMLQIAQRYQLPLRTQPGGNPQYPAGITPNGFGDYTAFNKAGIPVVAFEATNWEIADKDGYTQTELHGSYWHTPKDSVSGIEADFPYRPGVRLYTFTKASVQFLKSLR